MMTHAEAFLQAVRAEPDDDAPRLIFADWLEEQGDPRGAFIRIQCRLATLPPHDPLAVELRDEERALLDQHGEEWAAAFRDVADGWRFVRGFVEEATLSADSFLAHGETLFRDEPLRRVRLGLDGNRVSAVAESSLLAHVEALDLSGCGLGSNCVPVLLGSPHLTRLRCLNFADNNLEWQGVQALAQSPAPKQLEELDVSKNFGLADRAVRLLAGMRSPRLRTLRVAGTAMTWRGLCDLLRSRVLPELTTLDAAGYLVFQGCPDPGAEFARPEVRPLLRGLRELNLGQCGCGLRGLRALVEQLGQPRALRLAGCKLGDEGARLLAEAPNLAGLVALDLSRNALDSQGLQALAASPSLANLQELLLEDNLVRDRGVKALAASANCSHLTRLDLRKNKIGGPGIQALAASSNLRQLTSLDLGENWVGVESVRALVQSETLSGLTHLGLAKCNLEPDAVRLLAASRNLSRLTSLDLRENPPSDAAIDALAASPHLGRLERLELGPLLVNHRSRERLHARFRAALS
jgi:uncharacterized protein (TIGR02996 family)